MYVSQTRAQEDRIDHFAELAEENARIRQVYALRKEPGGGPLDPYNIYLLHELEEALAASFREMGLTSLKDVRILDVGCGSGGMLWRLQRFGAAPSNCFGVDILGDKLNAARQASPQAHFVEGSGAQLPFPDRYFDMVFQFLVFTSVPDALIKKRMASEMLRSIRPGGYLVWYDFLYSNPRNPHVRGVGRSEIEGLFPSCRIRFRRLTLAPPIGRLVARTSPALCRVLSALPILRTHYLCVIQKEG